MESADKLSKVLSSDVESGDEEDNLSLAKLKALNELKETLCESTPMSMEEYRLRNQEELDAKTIHKKCVKAVTASIISDNGASVPSDSDVSLPASTFDTMLSNSDGVDQEQSTGLKSDTTFSNGMESDSSEEWTIITCKKNKGKKSKNSPIRGLKWFKLNVQRMSKMSVIELSQLGQDLFDFSDLTSGHPLTHPLTHPSTHRYLQTKSNYIDKFKLY